MELDSLKKLYIDELRDLYSAETQLVKALPKMAKGAQNEDLKNGFLEHCEETKTQVERLEQIFKELGVAPKGKTCHAMKGLIEEGSEFLEHKGDPSVIDAGLISAAQKVEHYEMAGYGCVRTYAEMLNETNAVELLQETLDEESNTNEKLNELALNVINLEAAKADDSEEETEDSGDEEENTSKKYAGKKASQRSSHAQR
jgi:ferritin-like metal-binding protein YciE